jgi:hypothetical protein
MTHQALPAILAGGNIIMPVTAAGEGILFIKLYRLAGCMPVSAGRFFKMWSCERPWQVWFKKVKCREGGIIPAKMNQTVFLSGHCYHPTKKKV